MEPKTVPGVVNCVAYAKGQRVSDVRVEDISEVLEQPDGFVWLGLYEPGPELLQTVQREFGLHELAIEDALLAHQRPKLERYGDSLFMALRTAQMDREHHCAVFGETHIFVGARYIVSVRHGASLSYAPVRSRCEANPRLLALGPGFVMYAIMDFIVDQYFPVVDELAAELEGVEEAIFGERMSRETTEEIYNLKRSLLELKRAVSPLVDICNRLVRFDLELVPEEVRPYIRDVYDHSVRINESVDTLRELLTSALEANLSLIAVAQNESMKKLAAWAAIIAVPTMIAGIYGMNFEHMPELHWTFGYPVVMGGMITACLGLYLHFKRSGWL
jgi:magnesium Mg(2+) and cobalt Co(2+) transport protein (corA)